MCQCYCDKHESKHSFSYKIIIACILAVTAEILEICSNYEIIKIHEIMIFIISIFSITFSSPQVFKNAFHSIKKFSLDMNVLMSVAVIGAILIREFPEAAMVMALFGVSEEMEEKALSKAHSAIKNLLSFAPESATVMQENGIWVKIPAKEITIGSIIRVKPGEKISVDGEIIKGASSINQAPITGENIPVDKQIGDTVLAGSINTNGSFEYKVTKNADDSTLSRIIKAVYEAQNTKAHMERFVDQFAKYYTPIIFFVAIIVSFITNIYTGLVILVIGCPCALVISIPITITSAMACATKIGILVKGGIYIENARKITLLGFDKTGTLTKGKPILSDIIALDPKIHDHAFNIAYSLASLSNHPVSKAITLSNNQKSINLLNVKDFIETAGKGITGIIDKKTYFLGKDSSYKSDIINDLENNGKTTIILKENEIVIAIFAVSDSIREESKIALEELKNLGVKNILLTGDNEKAANIIGKEMGISDIHARLLPEQKMNIIDNYINKKYVVAMVGDGINDAPALAKAHISFAMAKNGTDTAMEAADIALMDDNIRKIPKLMIMSKKMHNILVQNISFALGIKILFFSLALLGISTMWMAVFADVGTTLIVVANGMRALNIAQIEKNI